MDFYGYSLLDARSKRNNDDSHSLRDPLANPFESPSKSQILLFLTTRFAKGDFSRLPTRKFFSRADDNRNSVQIIQLDVPCSHPACFCFKRMPAAIEIFACQLPMEINVNSIIREISWKPLQPLPLSLSLSFSLSLPLSKNTNCFPSMLDLDITRLYRYFGVLSSDRSKFKRFVYSVPISTNKHHLPKRKNRRNLNLKFSKYRD